MVWGVESPFRMAACLLCLCSPILCCFACAGYRHGDLWRDAFTLEETGTERDEEFDELSDQKLKDEEILSPSNNRRPYVCRYEKYGDEAWHEHYALLAINCMNLESAPQLSAWRRRIALRSFSISIRASGAFSCTRRGGSG